MWPAPLTENGVKNFVLISSDKAVNPTSVMGLTKRVAELIVSAMPLDGIAKSGTFLSVRFGNVLGQFRKRDSHFPAPNRCRRAAYRDPSGDAPLFHEHLRSRPTGIAGFHHGWRVPRCFVLDMGEPVLS